MPLIALVYVSFAKDRKISEEELSKILEEAHTNNRKLDVTGLLLYRKGLFIQALEGEEEVVTQLYDKIHQDSRHTNLLVLYKNSIKKRSFGDWSMGFKVLDDDSLRDVPGFNDMLDQPITMKYLKQNPGHVKTLLSTFRSM